MPRRKKRFWQSSGRLGGLAASVFACACVVGCSSAAPTTSPVVSASAVGGETAAADSPVAAALARADEAVTAIVSVPDGQRTFQNTVGAIDDLVARIELDTNMTMFMTYVSTDAAQREAGRKATEAVESWLIDLLKREDLYSAVKAYADTRPRLSGEEKRLLSYVMRDFRRAGMALPAQRRQRLKEMQKEISRLQIEFEQNIDEDETAVLLTRDELAGMPDDYFENPSLKRSGDVCLVRTSAPQIFPVWDHCTNEATRKKVWLAWKRRGGMKNVAVLEKILKLRAGAAQLIGYRHVADYEIEIKMAKNADNVKAFYAKLRPLVRAKAAKDYDELVEAKRSHTGAPDAELYPWDTWFYANRLRKTKYAVDAQRVREYFPLERVVEGLFFITQSLYGLEYREITERAASQGRPLWHEDVRLFEVWDKASGGKLGEFYIDLLPRENKYGHAAQWGLAQHKLWSDGTVTRPLAALVCNFTEPTPEKPSLLTHDEVETFFHEFGHCLHTILSEAHYWRFAGTSVQRDFVEAPSQMFENWVWDADVLRSFARHYQTGEPFPDSLLEGMMRARHLGSGLLAEHQFYYGLVDLTYHTSQDGNVDTTKIQAELFPEIELFDAVPETYYQAAFGHLANPGYVAGYYGYQWSLVYACDMFQRFKELGMLSPQAGRYYREKILARGGTIDGMDLLKDYLGREPRMDAYLRHLGLE